MTDESPHQSRKSPRRKAAELEGDSRGDPQGDPQGDSQGDSQEVEEGKEGNEGNEGKDKQTGTTAFAADSSNSESEQQAHSPKRPRRMMTRIFCATGEQGGKDVNVVAASCNDKDDDNDDNDDNDADDLPAVSYIPELSRCNSLYHETDGVPNLSRNADTTGASVSFPPPSSSSSSSATQLCEPFWLAPETSLGRIKSDNNGTSTTLNHSDADAPNSNSTVPNESETSENEANETRPRRGTLERQFSLQAVEDDPEPNWRVI